MTQCDIFRTLVENSMNLNFHAAKIRNSSKIKNAISKAIWFFESPYLVMENLSVPSISIERSLLSRINRKYVMLMTFSVTKKISLEIL